MDIIFDKDNTKRTVKFDPLFAAKTVRRTMSGENVKYKVRLNPEHDREKQLQQKKAIEHYIKELEKIDGLAGKL